MPDHWRSTPLGDVMTLEYGKALKKSDRDGEGYPVFSSAGEIGQHSVPLVEEGPVVVVGRKGSAGSVHWCDGPCSVIDTAYWASISGEADSRFLFHMLQHLELPRLSTETAVPGLNRERVYELSVTLPPVAEQRRIVEVVEEHRARLDAAEARVVSAQRRLEQLERSVLQAALAGPGSQNEDLREGWEWTTLAEVADWGSGGTPKKSDPSYYGGDIPWAVIGDLNDDVVHVCSGSITQRGLDESSCKLVDTGTILIAMYGSIGKLGIAGQQMTTNQAIAFARPKISRMYLFYYLKSQRSALHRAGKGATQKNISQTILKAWPIPVPPPTKQRRIVEVIEEHLTRVDRLKQAVDSAIDHATSLRRAILAAALNGRLTSEELAA